MKIYPIKSKIWFNHLSLLVEKVQSVYAQESAWKNNLTQQQQLKESSSACEARLLDINKLLEDLTHESVALLQSDEKAKQAAVDKKESQEKAAKDDFEKKIEPLKSGITEATAKHQFSEIAGLLAQIQEAEKALESKKAEIANSYKTTLAQLDKDYQKKQGNLGERTNAQENKKTTEDREQSRLSAELKNLTETLRQQAEKLSNAYTELGESVQKLRSQLHTEALTLQSQTKQTLVALTTEEKTALKQQSTSHSMAVDEAIAMLSQLISPDQMTFPDTHPFNHLAGLTKAVHQNESDQREWAVRVFTQHRTKNKARQHLNQSRLQQAIDKLNVEQQQAEQQYNSKRQQAITQYESQIAELDQQFEAMASDLEKKVQSANQARDYLQLAKLANHGTAEKQQCEEKKARVTNDHQSAIESLSLIYQRDQRISQSSMEQLQVAKSSKQRHQTAFADQIQQQYQAIQDQKVILLKDVKQIRDQVKCLKYSVQAGGRDVIKQGLPHTPGIFKLNAAQKVALKAQSVADKVTAEEIQTILTAVTEAQITTVQACLKKNPCLIHAQADVTDPEGRFFPQVTVLQYASWACDMEMCDAILQYLSPRERAKQLQALDYHRPDITDQHGQQFDFTPLIERYDTYINNYSNSSYEQRCAMWIQVGAAQEKLPDWVILMMTEKGAQVAWTLKEVRQPVDRTPNDDARRFRSYIYKGEVRKVGGEIDGGWYRGRGGERGTAVRGASARYGEPMWARAGVGVAGAVVAAPSDAGVVKIVNNTSRDYNLSLRANSETNLSCESTTAHRPRQ